MLILPREQLEQHVTRNEGTPSGFSDSNLTCLALPRLTWWLLYFDFGTVLLPPHPYVLAKVVCSTHNALSLLPTRVERREMVTDEARPRTGAFVRIELSSMVVIISRASSPIRHILVHVVRLELCRQVHERLKPVFRHSDTPTLVSC